MSPDVNAATELLPMALAAYRREVRRRGVSGAKGWLWDTQGTFHSLCRDLKRTEREWLRAQVLKHDPLEQLSIDVGRDIEGNTRRPGIFD